MGRNLRGENGNENKDPSGVQRLEGFIRGGVILGMIRMESVVFRLPNGENMLDVWMLGVICSSVLFTSLSISVTDFLISQCSLSRTLSLFTYLLQVYHASKELE